MRSYAHARRLSSHAASSRHEIDAMVVGNPVPIGIPALFLADQLSRCRSAEQILSGNRGLIAEYAGTEGYVYAWGHLIEQRLSRFVLWRVVPGAVWERLSDVRAGPALLIEDLLTLKQPGISPALEPHLPSGLACAVFKAPAAQRRSSRCISQPRATAPASVFRHDEWAPDGRRPTVQRRVTA